MQHIGHPLFLAILNMEEIRFWKGTTENKYKSFIHNCFELMPYQALHAQSLGFMHPVNGEIKFLKQIC